MRTIQRWPVLGIYVGLCLLTPPWAHPNIQHGTGCDSHACHPPPGGERGLCEKKDQRHGGSNSHLSLRIQEWHGPSAHGDSRRGGSAPHIQYFPHLQPGQFVQKYNSVSSIPQPLARPSLGQTLLGWALMNCTSSPSSCNKLVHLTVHSEKCKPSDEM